LDVTTSPLAELLVVDSAATSPATAVLPMVILTKHEDDGDDMEFKEEDEYGMDLTQ
ncbi:hypothetical protein NEUTE2DRAFT_62422, partial [Neurospora tetrasperma FGSC 2509]